MHSSCSILLISKCKGVNYVTGGVTEAAHSSASHNSVTANDGDRVEKFMSCARCSDIFVTKKAQELLAFGRGLVALIPVTCGGV